MWICMGTGCLGACECSNKISGSVKCGEFLDYQRTSQLPKKDSATCSYQWQTVFKQLVVVSDDCFKFISYNLCSYSHFVWAMSWTAFSMPIHDIIWFIVFPFMTQYWNIFPCAEVWGGMWLFMKVAMCKKVKVQVLGNEVCWATFSMPLAHRWTDSHRAAAGVSAILTVCGIVKITGGICTVPGLDSSIPEQFWELWWIMEHSLLQFSPVTIIGLELHAPLDQYVPFTRRTMCFLVTLGEVEQTVTQKWCKALPL